MSKALTEMIALRLKLAVVVLWVLLFAWMLNPAAVSAGWERQHPEIQGTYLYCVWGSGPNDVFAGGAAGIILHYNGTAWTAMASGITSSSINSIWGSGPKDVFAVGDYGTILHYDGNAWTAMDSGTAQWLYGVWGSSPNNVFAVGGGGTILH
jgi:hypothetical protein